MYKSLQIFIFISVYSFGISGKTTYGQIVSSYDLPLVIINTYGKTIIDEPKVKVHLGIIDNGPGQPNELSDSFNIYDGWAGIEIRGSSSQSFPQKSYAIETRDLTGENLNAEILGLPEENDWILYAPYNDKSLMRNVLIFQLSNEMGLYAPRTRFCELILNENYNGVYVLMEKIKQDKNRVNIAKLNPTDISGDELTGGYILKVDWAEAGNGWYTSYAHKGEDSGYPMIQYVDPKTDSLNSIQKEYIKNYISNFENYLKSPDFNNIQTAYTNYINTPSFIDFIICNELSNNVDAYSLSTFFYKDKDSKGGKITMGPLWDFNHAFGNCDYGGELQTFSFDTYLDPAPKWFTRLLEDEHFANQLNCRWIELRETILNTEKVMSKIDSIALYLADAQDRNNTRWNLYGKYIWPNNFVGANFEEEIDYLKNWITERFLWLDNNMPGNCSLLSEHSYLSTTKGFSLYPNPNHGNFFIGMEETESRVLRFEIINSQGNVIKTGNLKPVITEFEMEYLTPGLYIFKLKEDNFIRTNKFLVQ